MLDASPAAVKVQVLNGSAVSGVAARAAAALTGRGFDVTGDAAGFGYTSSVIEYASAASQPEVATLAKQLTSVTVRRDPSLAPGTIDLILGSSFTALAPRPAVSPAHRSAHVREHGWRARQDLRRHHRRRLVQERHRRVQRVAQPGG